MKLNLNNRERIILSAVIGGWGLFLIGSGFAMSNNMKPIINTKYNLKVSEKQIAKAQAKSNEIKLKDITIEINNPISLDVKDYLENIENLNEQTLKALRLDTSRVNINEAGTYEYTITYNKKKYIANVIVKEKELPKVTFTLKTISLTAGDSLSTNPRSYINENISDEIVNNITLDLSQVNNQTQGNYDYYITYNGTKYQGKIEIRYPGATVITRPNTDPPKNEEDKKDETENNSSDTTNPTTEQKNKINFIKN